MSTILPARKNDTHFIPKKVYKYKKVQEMHATNRNVDYLKKKKVSLGLIINQCTQMEVPEDHFKNHLLHEMAYEAILVTYSHVCRTKQNKPKTIETEKERTEGKRKIKEVGLGWLLTWWENRTERRREPPLSQMS